MLRQKMCSFKISKETFSEKRIFKPTEKYEKRIFKPTEKYEKVTESVKHKVKLRIVNIVFAVDSYHLDS